ncbi:MAG: ABC transporter substrate-binding protein [Dehalococcoidia bacterium]|nr:MAG: ABC transporter substrate-binding protein [Dehalococcoidia bacterium]
MRLLSPTFLLLVTLACSGPAAPGPGPRGEMVTIAVASLPPTLDPHRFAALSPRRFGLFEALTTISPRGEVDPELAARWEVREPTRWRVLLVTGRRFHDGTAVTAAAVKASLDRASEPANRLPVAGYLATVREVQAIDAITLEVVTTAPDPLLPRRLSQVAILPSSLAERPLSSDWSREAIGSGPYRLAGWAPNERLVLEAVAEHPAQPAVRTVVVRPLPEGAARVAALQRGEADLIVDTPAESAAALRAAGMTVAAGEAGVSVGVLLDATRPSLRDRRVRQALNYALDKERFVREVYRGFATLERGQPIGPSTVGFHSSLEPYPYDPAQAKALLSAAESPRLTLRFDVFVTSPEVRESAFLIQSQLAEVGVTLDLQVVTESTSYLDRLAGRLPRAELTTATLLSVPLLDAEPVLQWFRSTPPAGAPWLENPRFDAAVAAASTTLDPAARQALLQQAVAELRADPAVLFLVQPQRVWATRGLTGVEPRPDNEPRPEVLRRR